jgi:hypothetical protein
MITGRSLETNAVSRMAWQTSRNGTPLLRLGPCTTRGSRLFADGVEIPSVFGGTAERDGFVVDERFLEVRRGT